jgi:RHS repeat-associated protein
VIALTDGTGAIAERYAYSAYGEPVFVSAPGTVLADSANDNRYTYTGREWDEEVSLYHFRARMYDAESGRFTSIDPASYDGSKWNLREFLNGRPIIKLDPYGLDVGSDGHEAAGANLLAKLLAMCESCIQGRTSEVRYVTCNKENCVAEARNIANGFVHLLEHGGLWIDSPFDQRYKGYFCYEWANGFDWMIKGIGGTCFKTEIGEAIEPGQVGQTSGGVHFWVEISLPCSTAESVFIDDGFTTSPPTFVHETPPIPEGYKKWPAQLPFGCSRPRATRDNGCGECTRGDYPPWLPKLPVFPRSKTTKK